MQNNSSESLLRYFTPRGWAVVIGIVLLIILIGVVI